MNDEARIENYKNRELNKHLEARYGFRVAKMMERSEIRIELDSLTDDIDDIAYSLEENDVEQGLKELDQLKEKIEWLRGEI